MEGLRDIKEVVEIDEPSLQILIALLLGLLILLAWGAYLFKNRRRRRKKPTAKALAKEALEAFDYDDTKSVVYGFVEYGSLFLNEKNEAEFNAIAEALNGYKYKKEVPPLEEGLKGRIKAFIGGVKV